MCAAETRTLPSNASQPGSGSATRIPGRRRRTNSSACAPFPLQRAATLLLATPSLARIPESLVHARRTRRIIRQNLAWALGYNLLALPLAAAGLVAPWLAALGMAMSSLIVTLNALRLARAPRCAEAA